jgi:hypothetical protein
MRNSSCYPLQDYNSTTSSHSNSPTIFFNSFFFLVRSTKLKGGTTIYSKIIGSNFFHKKSTIFKLPNCNMHFLKFVSISTKENICISICDPIMSRTCQVRKINVRNIISYFFNRSKRHLISFTSIWKHQKIYNSQLTSSFVGSLLSTIILKLSKL